ncbi:unnamed protein product [Lupinus luteus]|uniref:S-protein homolog n=1 Tax=Lupinus luteus TaxID=3873 RepID=A0AAV1X7U5_LUPLU
MAALVNKIVLLSFMLVPIFVMMDGVESFKFIPRAVIGIENQLPNLKLTIHCKDKYRDNGFHTLAPGENYRFGFITAPFFIKRTQWFCLFSWHGESRNFDIYVEERDDCSYCQWLIRKSGPCKYYATHLDCYQWKTTGQHERQGRKMLLISNTSIQQEPPLSLQPLNSQGRD